MIIGSVKFPLLIILNLALPDDWFVPGPNLVNLKLDYKTEEEWEYALRYVFSHFYSNYNIIKQ